MTLPASLEYGHVVGRIILAVADAADGDRMPDSAPAQGTVTFTPKNPQIRVGEPAPVLVVKQPISCTLDGSGNLIDPEGAAGVWLVTGVYSVKYSLGPTVATVTHDIEVTAGHTDVDPLDLTTAMPPGGPILTASEYAELSSRIDALVVGAVSWDTVADKPATFPPSGHADTHAVGGTDPITPASIEAVATSDDRLRDTGWRLLGLINGWTANGASAATAPAFRRIGKVVYIRTRNLEGSAATSAHCATLPAGFIPSSADGGIILIGSTVRQASVAGSGILRVPGGEGATGVGVSMSFAFITEQAFPAEPYPSTPA